MKSSQSTGTLTIRRFERFSRTNGTGVRIGLVHDARPARGRAERLRRRFPEADAAVFGQSHMPLHGRTADGFQIFNPGSPTERRQAPRHTMGIAHAHPGELTFDLVSLE